MGYGNFKVDNDLETTGIIRDYGDFRVTVARAGGSNKAYDKLLEEKGRPYEAAIQVGSMDNAVATKILKQVFSETVIRNWEVQVDGKWKKGLFDPQDDTKILPFNAANVLKVLNEKSLHDLWTDIHKTASRGSLYAASIEEARAGN